MKKVNYLMLMIAIAGLTVSCNKMSYKKTSSGLVYQIFPSNGKDSLLKYGQIAKFQVITKLNDSLLYTSYGKIPAYAKLIPTVPPPYNLLEVLPMMRIGDSAVIVQMVDTIMLKGEELPPAAKKGDKIVTTFRIIGAFAVDSTAMNDYNAEMAKDAPRQMKEQQEQVEKMKKERKELLAKDELELQQSGEITKELQAMESYLAAKNIKAEKTGKGTYVKIDQQGTGAAAEDGKYVHVKYTGRHLTTDSVFQSSEYAFKLGNGDVIQGWDEGLKMLKQGGKATLYVPGFLAYGKRPPAGSPFQPFEAMKFDVELIQVSDTPIQR